MKIISLTPVLYTADVRSTIDLYVGVLGFSCPFPDDNRATIHHGETAIMLSLPNAHLPFEKAHFTGSFYFRLHDVDALWEQLKDTTQVVYPIEDFPYGMREFAIYDNNGYILQFGQSLEEQHTATLD
ncbi:VOC family protein [Deminuibacter soli]|uniref:Bleomycin resistance family protein n=1 Tax=Deminuibacter soli TaxID=2291815 RepID=A0A3E1NCJ6_9BACT|nr:VOC family protein [Deminuibacter soli]RFM25706.1 bleomycin resistance family protein [Deminuibacter soli]